MRHVDNLVENEEKSTLFSTEVTLIHRKINASKMKVNTFYPFWSISGG